MDIPDHRVYTGNIGQLHPNALIRLSLKFHRETRPLCLLPMHALLPEGQGKLPFWPVYLLGLVFQLVPAF